MKWPKVILITTIVNTLFFVWTYATHIFKIDWVIAGVLHELFIFPMIALSPVLFIASIIMLFKRRDTAIKITSLAVSTTVMFTITWLFYQDLS